jgi:flagellar hook protein FlgE
MSSTFSIALSALQAQSEAINTTGNNLANMNTNGFKGSDVAFKDLFGETLGSNASFEVGLGVGVPISETRFNQGPIQASNSPLAAAIQGSGFFVVNDPSNQQLFTRDGNFTLDSSGTLKTLTGETVQGWAASSSGISATGAPTNIVLPTGTVLPAKATGNLSVSANLNASATVGSTGASYQVPIQVIDSLGNTHTLSVDFTKTAANTWSYNVTVDGGDLKGGTLGQQTSLLSTPGSISFDTSGNMSASSTTSPVALNLTSLADGAANMSINWNLFDTNGNGTVTQYAQANTASSSQDGSQAAQLTQVGIETGGQVVATFSNGQQKVEAQLALASIQNPDSLKNGGNNNFSVTGKTATPSIGMPQTGGRGNIEGGALEGSNVDMATQFTNLIVYQSGYQAASRVITTADQMNQALLSLIH